MASDGFMLARSPRYTAGQIGFNFHLLKELISNFRHSCMCREDIDSAWDVSSILLTRDFRQESVIVPGVVFRAAADAFAIV